MIRYDSEISDKIISIAKETGSALKSDISSKILKLRKGLF